MKNGKRLWLYLVVITSFTSNIVYADWFGPKSYDDCILEGMRGVTSDLAAREVKMACLRKFPPQPKPEPVTRKITGKDANKLLNNVKLSGKPNYFGGPNYEVIFHNPLEAQVEYITIAVRIDDEEPVLYREYSGATPLSSGKAYFSINFQADSKITSWRIHELELSDAGR